MSYRQEVGLPHTGRGPKSAREVNLHSLTALLPTMTNFIILALLPQPRLSLFALYTMSWFLFTT